MRCDHRTISVGKIWIDQRKIDVNPVYQREGGVWSVEKKQLFIDSLLNGFDIPKLYFNELAQGGPYDFAIIDGKQRVTTILSFMNNEFSLASDFAYSNDALEVSDQPRAGQRYQDFSERAKEVLRGVELTLTSVRNGSEEDIEHLFARLNNGEPLNSAESRNAIGGDMAALIREIAERDFFARKVRFSNSRFAFREVSCKLLYMEWQRIQTGNDSCPDLKKKFLDNFVKANRELSADSKSKLTREIDKRLSDLEKCFIDDSPELSKQSYPQFFFLVVRMIQASYTRQGLLALLKEFFPQFTLMRAENNEKPEEERDPVLVEFGRLTQQGTNDSGSMTRRAEILIRYFLISNPDVQFKDTRRAFNEAERYAIWIRAEKKCQKCQSELPHLDLMDADHEMQFVDGGQTKLANARCLCIPCNRGNRV
jgi:hypothetical protein